MAKITNTRTETHGKTTYTVYVVDVDGQSVEVNINPWGADSRFLIDAADNRRGAKSDAEREITAAAARAVRVARGED